MKKQRPHVLYLTTTEKFVSDVSELADRLSENKSELCKRLISAGISLVTDPAPLPKLPTIVNDYRRALRLPIDEVVGSLLREDPPYGATVSDNMLRLLEKTVEAQAETIAIQRAEIARLRCYER
jgi:hypothetical protein